MKKIFLFFRLLFLYGLKYLFSYFCQLTIIFFLFEIHFDTCKISVNNQIIGEDVSTDSPDTSAPPTECTDSIPSSKCEEWKNRGICDKKWVQERCKATCQLCTSYCGFVVISRTSILIRKDNR